MIIKIDKWDDRGNSQWYIFHDGTWFDVYNDKETTKEHIMNVVKSFRPDAEELINKMQANDILKLELNEAGSCLGDVESIKWIEHTKNIKYAGMFHGTIIIKERKNGDDYKFYVFAPSDKPQGNILIIEHPSRRGYLLVFNQLMDATNYIIERDIKEGKHWNH